jgi:hypothetical protein
MIWKILAISAALATGGAFWWWVTRLWRRRVLRGRRNRGRRGEEKAAKVLTDAGYRILEDQASREVTVQVDGAARPYTLRPDYLVQRRDQRYVAEVKTGKKAPNPLYTPTRRQLVEYGVCFPDHGLLLVDMETRRVHRVHWPQMQVGAVHRAPTRRLFLLLAAVFALGLTLGALTRVL